MKSNEVVRIAIAETSVIVRGGLCLPVWRMCRREGVCLLP